ncbi:hypothetical protein [Pantoea sp. C2G6]|uniref:hypothetical protein n=1 Tax=Pantoea sp. C2G6 TaxID=3243084 RepID=UPI003ED96BB8
MPHCLSLQALAIVARRLMAWLARNLPVVPWRIAAAILSRVAESAPGLMEPERDSPALLFRWVTAWMRY